MDDLSKYLYEVETRYNNLLESFRHFAETYHRDEYKQDFTAKFQNDWQVLDRLITNYAIIISNSITNREIVSRENLDSEDWRIFFLTQRYRAIAEASYNSYQNIILPKQTYHT